MSERQVMKQFSLYLPLNEWRAIRDESIRRHVTMTDLVRSWIKPSLDCVILDKLKSERPWMFAETRRNLRQHPKHN
jgi:hypothetical protein